MTPAEIAQRQLDAYNAQDLDRFCAFFAEDVVVADYGGGETLRGMAAYRERYATLFATHPQNHVTLLGRIAIGNTVIDHEEVRRTPDAAPFHVAAIYTIADGKIARVDFVRP